MAISRIDAFLDAEYYRLSLWNCVFFIFGILCYFTLKVEPSTKLVTSIFFLSLHTIYFRKYSILCAFLSSIIIAFTSGILVSKIRANNLNPVALQESIVTNIRGTISNIKQTVKGAQITLDDVKFGTFLLQDEQPTRVKIHIKVDDAKLIMIGDYIEVPASLTPPPRSVLPGGYDFGLYAYFGEIGATGYSVGRVDIIERTDPDIKSSIQRIRKYLYQRFVNLMGDDIGNFAAALLLGEQGGMNRTILQNMRFAGVSHVLCVSGMHLSLVAGIFFLSARILLNLSDKLAWNYNIKNIAAVIAIIGSGFYLMLSGMQIAATRAFITTLVIMTAIIFSRMPFSRRSLSIAAMIILSLNPEYTLHPSFQMSFVAVLALIGGFEFFVKNRKLFGNTKGTMGKFKMGFVSNIYSTTLAGTATTPFILYHFYIMSNYTVLANMFVVPLITLVVMPLGILAMLLAPFGLDQYILVFMGFFINIIIEISNWVASMPGSVWYFGYITPISLIIYMIGFFWLMLWSTWIRLLGIPVICISLALMCFSPKPDVIFDAKSEILGVKHNEGKLEIFGDHISAFQKNYLGNWFGQKNPIYIREDISKSDYLITTALGRKVGVLFNELDCRGDIVLNMIRRNSHHEFPATPSAGYAVASISGSHEMLKRVQHDNITCPNQISADILEYSGAILVFCDQKRCKAEFEKSERFKFR